MTDADVAERTRISPGSVVELLGLTRAELNGKLCVVKRFDDDSGRYEVYGVGSRSLGIKPENLTQRSIVSPEHPAFSESRRFQHVIFWPRPGGARGEIPVHAFDDDDWPADVDGGEPTWPARKSILKGRLGWKDPEILSGVESDSVAKPNFQVYFDAGDQTSLVNHTAVAIWRNLPGYEIAKLPLEIRNQQPRGACVLVHSVMTHICGSSWDPVVRVTKSSNTNRKFTLQHLRNILLFQESSEGRAQYEAHDNWMHRMFGHAS